LKISNKLLERLKRPTGVLLFLLYLITFISVIGSIIALVLDFMSSASLSVIAYVIFGVAGVSLGYTVYTVVIYAPGLRGRMISYLEKREITSRMLRNFGFRTVVFAIGSFAASVAYAAFNAFLGIVGGSIWYGALAAYYILLALTRGGLLLYHRRKSKDGECEELVRLKKYRASGMLLLILNIALSSAIAQMIFDERTFVYTGWVIYAFAAYAFYKITMSIINLLRARKQDDMTVRGIRDINLIDAAVSILALQTALLHTFNEGDGVSISVFNTATGIVVSGFAISFSIYMIVKANKMIKRIKTVDNNG